MNESSKSRNPNGKTIVFKDYSGEAQIKSRTARLKLIEKANGYILDNSEDPKNLNVLCQLFGINSLQPDDRIQEQLFDKVEANAEAFVKVITQAQTEAREALEEARNMELIAGGDGSEAVYRDKAKMLPLFPGKEIVEGDLVDFMMDRFLDEDMNAEIMRLKAIQEAALAATFN